MQQEIKVLDSGYIKLIEHWGSDERIIEAARMSTNKGFLGWGPTADGKPGDERLLAYLYHNKHMTPFEMAGAIIEVQAPIFVFREWQRHRTQSYNELSARYTELPDMSYIPSIERLMVGGQSKSNKQASGEPQTEHWALSVQAIIKTATQQSRLHYEGLLAAGLSRELARSVIPVNQYSRMRASANLRNWLQFLELRMAVGAQEEIRVYANALHAVLKGVFPRTVGLFDEAQAA